MKKPYQIESKRAVLRWEQEAAGRGPVQMALPMAEAMGWLREGVGELMRQAGACIMQTLMAEEVEALAGKRGKPQTGRRANRWGSERGYCVVMGAGGASARTQRG